MHYGHPDVFDRVFHITRGGISKASRIINISEDIYAGRSSVLVFYIRDWELSYNGMMIFMAYLSFRVQFNAAPRQHHSS
jgi:1,3-beta-glucan synthase component